MKTKLELRTAAATLMLIASMVAAPAQPIPKNAPVVNPATGLPAPGGVPTIDPNTGLPLPPPEPQWIDTSWSDPDIILTNVVYDNLPLSEVARNLRERFQDYFDILPMPKTFGNDWGSTVIELRLKNVKASDVFNAMNRVFENDRTPLRWELKMNYNRPMAQLRVLPEAAPEPQPQSKPAETHRMVYFVGDLVGDEKSGGMTMDQIVKTISEIWPADLGKLEGVIQFHKEAQLLVVNGTPDELEFIHQTLRALESKAHLEHSRRIVADLKSKAGESSGNQKTNGDDSK